MMRVMPAQVCVKYTSELARRAFFGASVTRALITVKVLSRGLLDKLLWRPLECFFRFNHHEMNASHIVFLREEEK